MNRRCSPRRRGRPRGSEMRGHLGMRLGRRSRGRARPETGCSPSRRSPCARRCGKCRSRESQSRRRAVADPVARSSWAQPAPWPGGRRMRESSGSWPIRTRDWVSLLCRPPEAKTRRLLPAERISFSSAHVLTIHRERDRSPPRPPGFRNSEHLRPSCGETDSASPREDRFIATLVHPHGCFSYLVGVVDLAMRTISTLAVAGLLVLGTFAAAGALSSPFTFLGEAMGGQSRWTEGLATDTLITSSSSGTIVAAIPVGNGPYDLAYDSGNGYVYVANFNSNSCRPTD